MVELKRRHDPLARLDRWCYIKVGGGKQPPAPDPAIQTAQEAAANRYNVTSPFGSQTWSQGPRSVIGYDSSGRPIQGQQYTQNIELNPSEQRQYELHNQIGEALMGQGLTGIEGGLPEYTDRGARPELPGGIGTPDAPGAFNPRALPNMGDPGTFDPNQPQLGTFNPSELTQFAPKGEYSMSGATPDAAKAHYARIAELLGPQHEKQTQGFEQRMSNAGLPVGSEAYNESFGEMQDAQNRSLSQAAYEAAEMAPQLSLAERGQQFGERGQLFGEDLSRRSADIDLRELALGERGQMFGEALDTRGRQMTDRGQLFGEGVTGFETDLAGRRQGMGEREQLFGEDLAAQADARTGFGQAQGEQTRMFNEDLARRQQYYNEIAAALGGQQLNPINAGGGGGDMSLNVANAYEQYNLAQLARYNAQQEQQGGLMGGLFGLGGAALGNWQHLSDERLKDDIEPVGELPGGEGVYEYHYKWEDPSEPKHVGVMAQELEETQPDAVSIHPSGYRQVDYRKVVARALMEAA